MRDVAYIALGSNLGDRAQHLAAAVEAIGALPKSRLLAASEVRETAPIGPVGQGPFLNQMVAIETELAPEALLTELLQIEWRQGRVRGERWGPRTLDLDIVWFDAQTVNTKTLTVPHPEMRNRTFWVRQFFELQNKMGLADGSAGQSFQMVGVWRDLPPWAQVSSWRKEHIRRVGRLMMDWLREMKVPDDEADAWLEAAVLHDALRDAPEEELRQLAGDSDRDVELLHGPAVANLLEQRGESSPMVRLAVRHHTVGCADWDRTGRALYMADFLEPGRTFLRDERAFLAKHVPHDFEGVFRQVLRLRLDYALREGFTLFPETVALWNAVR